MPKCLLGIDNGGTVSKAALFDLEGRELAVGSRKTESISPEPGFDERDMVKMWGATADAVKEVLAEV